MCGEIGADGAVHGVALQSFSGGIYVGEVTYVVVRGQSWIESGIETRPDAFTSPNASVSVRLDSRGVARFCVTNTNVPEIRCWESPGRPASAPIPHARWGSLAVDAHDALTPDVLRRLAGPGAMNRQ